MSEGSLENFQQNIFHELFHSEQIIKEEILSAKVVGFDETGCKVNKKLNWIHSASTETETLYGIHPRRGNEAMNEIGILPNYSGIGVHDGWASYQEYDFFHSLCNAHRLRELTHTGEQLGVALCPFEWRVFESPTVEKNRNAEIFIVPESSRVRLY